MKLFRIAWLALAACMGLAIAARMLFGPFRFALILVTVPLNPEGLFGLAITVLLLKQVSTQAFSESRRRWILPAMAVAAVTILALRRSLGIYFLSDDFIVVKYANQWTAASFPYLVTHGGGDGFFRPFGFVVLALVAKWAVLNPVLWHAWALALHAVNSVLVMFLARRVGHP